MNFQKLIVILLPFSLRKPRIKSLLYVLIYPIVKCYDNLMLFRDDRMIKMNVTSQAPWLERIIFLETGLLANIRNSDEQVDFIVDVDGVDPESPEDINKVNRIKALIERYKMAGRSYSMKLANMVMISEYQSDQYVCVKMDKLYDVQYTDQTCVKVDSDVVGQYTLPVCTKVDSLTLNVQVKNGNYGSNKNCRITINSSELVPDDMLEVTLYLKGKEDYTLPVTLDLIGFRDSWTFDVWMNFTVTYGISIQNASIIPYATDNKLYILSY